MFHENFIKCFELHTFPERTVLDDLSVQTTETDDDFPDTAVSISRCPGFLGSASIGRSLMLLAYLIFPLFFLLISVLLFLSGGHRKDMRSDPGEQHR